MKFLFVSITILLWVGVLMLGINSLAADTGTVTATVTASVYSVTVQDGAVTYGSLALSAAKSTTAGGVNDIQHAGNSGNQTARLNIQGANSSPGNWTIAGAIGSETYTHKFATDGGALWTALSTSYTYLVPSIAGNSTATQDFHLEVRVPSSTAQTAQQSLTVTVQATTP